MRRFVVACFVGLIVTSITAPVGAAPPVPGVTGLEWTNEAVALGGCEMAFNVAWEKWPGGKKTVELFVERAGLNGAPFDPVIIVAPVKSRSGSVAMTFPESTALMMPGFRLTFSGTTGDWHWPGPDADTSFTFTYPLRCGDTYLWP